MPIFRRRPTVQPLASINLTSLLDVTFVLLLAFMIVAPTLKTGLSIDLPKVEESKPLTPRKSVTVSLRKIDEAENPFWIYLENRRVSFAELRSELEKLYGLHAPNLDILIEADRLVPCEALLKVFAIVKDVGIESVGILTEPEKK